MALSFIEVSTHTALSIPSSQDIAASMRAHCCLYACTLLPLCVHIALSIHTSHFGGMHMALSIHRSQYAHYSLYACALLSVFIIVILVVHMALSIHRSQYVMHITLSIHAHCSLYS